MWLKELVKRSAIAVAFHQRLAWRLHVLRDWWGTRIWTWTTEVTTPLGFKLASGIHPAYRMMREGTFEQEEVELISRLLPKVDLFVDVGANLGYYTCLALWRGKPALSFEPQQQNLAFLMRNLSANGWQEKAHVIPVALGRQPGLLNLYGASGPSASLVRNWAGYSSRYHQLVPVSTLDRMVSHCAGQRLLIKIDVEGAEYEVLQGAVSTLGQTPKPIWLVEICLDEFHPGGVNAHYGDIFRTFFDGGYQAFTATDPLRKISASEVKAWLSNGHSDSGTFNYVFAESADLLNG